MRHGKGGKKDIRRVLCTLLTLLTLWLRSHRFLGDFIPLGDVGNP